MIHDDLVQLKKVVSNAGREAVARLILNAKSATKKPWTHSFSEIRKASI